MPRSSLSLLPSLLGLFFTASVGAGCVLYGGAEEYKTCDDVVCGSHASCGDNAECYCEPGYEGNPYDGCVDITPDVDPSCKADCGQNAYCSEGACYCELDHVAVCGVNAGCMPEKRVCDGAPDCPNSADENVAVCGDPVYQEFLITDDCDDGLDIEWRLYAQDRDWAWPDATSTFVTSVLGAEDYQTIQCFDGETICMAGAAGDTVWGLNLDGSGSCDTCCFLCGTGMVNDLGFQTCQ